MSLEDQGNKLYRLPVRQGHIDSIEALITDGLHLLSAGYDGTVRVWSVSDCALRGMVDN